MKIGSIVECINPFIGKPGVKAVPRGKYIVRDVVFDGGGLLLEEIANEKCNLWIGEHCVGFGEPAYYIERFREIEFPPSLAEEIQNALTRPVEIQEINKALRKGFISFISKLK